MNNERKVLFVIAPKDFQEEEYFTTKEFLENSGITVSTASINSGECYGVSGKVAFADSDLLQINTIDFDGIFYIGGPGVEILFSEDHAISLAKEFFNDGKMVGAICWAPVILARAGIVNGKKVTVWSGASDQLIAAGAKVVDERTVVDGQIITANGPMAAEEFGQRIFEAYGV